MSTSTGDAPSKKGKCFAIMPITTPSDMVSRYGDDPDHFLHMSEYLFRPAVEAAGYVFCPAKVESNNVIQSEIIKNLIEADLVLCDASGWNANVFFEFGIRAALNKPAAIVMDNLTDRPPFDVDMLNTHKYNWSGFKWVLDEEIPSLTRFIERAGDHTDNAIWRIFGIKAAASGLDRSANEADVNELLLAQIQSVNERLAEYERRFKLLELEATTGGTATATTPRYIVLNDFGKSSDRQAELKMLTAWLANKEIDQPLRLEVLRRLSDQQPQQTDDELIGSLLRRAERYRAPSQSERRIMPDDKPSKDDAGGPSPK